MCECGVSVRKGSPGLPEATEPTRPALAEFNAQRGPVECGGVEARDNGAADRPRSETRVYAEHIEPGNQPL